MGIYVLVSFSSSIPPHQKKRTSKGNNLRGHDTRDLIVAIAPPIQIRRAGPLRRHRPSSRHASRSTLALPQRRQQAQQAPAVRPIVRLRPDGADQVGRGLAGEMRPAGDLVRECFGDGGGGEDADGGVRGREAVVEEGGEDFFWDSEWVVRKGGGEE